MNRQPAKAFDPYTPQKDGDSHDGIIPWEAPEAELYLPTWAALCKLRAKIGRTEPLTHINTEDTQA